MRMINPQMNSGIYGYVDLLPSDHVDPGKRDCSMAAQAV
jgi:hypothetical protein